jgi:hypothetical protein
MNSTIYIHYLHADNHDFTEVPSDEQIIAHPNTTVYTLAAYIAGINDGDISDNAYLAQTSNELLNIKPENILKVADILHTNIPAKTLAFIEHEAESTYEDKRLKEHIYNIGDILEDEQIDEIPADIENDLNQIQILCNQYDCGYFRIVYP